MLGDFPLLKTLVETPGVSGDEANIRQAVIAAIQGCVDSIEVDALGNLIALKKAGPFHKGSAKKVVCMAHLDEIGFMVTHIDKNGFIRFLPLGGFDPKTLTAQRVLVHGKKRLLGVMGSKPIHTMSDEEKKRCPEIKDYFIDTGLPVDEVQALVSVGDSITREQSLIQLGHLVSGKSLDNRLGVYVLVQALKKLKDIPVDFYAVFSTQEEVGIRGARVAAASIAPDMGLALDVTIANDLPDTAEHDQISHLGAGPAIKLADSGSISHKGVVNYLKGVAAKQGIACQLEILPKGGTDASGIQYLSGRGVATGALSIPLRYMHSSVETAHPRDIEQTVELLAAAISLCDPFPY